jgi:capsular exopolysaccharide synthesis family protein
VPIAKSSPAPEARPKPAPIVEAQVATPAPPPVAPAPIESKPVEPKPQAPPQPEPQVQAPPAIAADELTFPAAPVVEPPPQPEVEPEARVEAEPLVAVEAEPPREQAVADEPEPQTVVENATPYYPAPSDYVDSMIGPPLIFEAQPTWQQDDEPEDEPQIEPEPEPIMEQAPAPVDFPPPPTAVAAPDVPAQPEPMIPQPIIETATTTVPDMPVSADPDQNIVIPAPHPGVGHYAPEIVVHHDRGSVITEQYRAIRLQILARCRNRKLQVHVITSSAPNEGKTVTSVNLAMAFAELQNKKTLLIEGDLRRPSLQGAIGQKQAPGLLHLLRGQIDDIDQAIHPSPYDNVHIMPAGDYGTTSSTELVSSHRFAEILDQLRERYDHIFIDTPPVISVTDACIFGALADEVLLVVRLNATPVEVVDRAKRLLRASNCEVAGVILTHMRYHIPKYLYRYV